MRMPSGAGHDAQILARRMRSAMLFVPSINGVSHHWSEDTSDEDIMLGAQVFADAAAAILQGGVSDMAIVIQESLRGLFYAPYYAALALGAYEQGRGRGALCQRADPGAGARRAVRRHGRCRLGRADAGQPDVRAARPIATSSASPRR